MNLELQLCLIVCSWNWQLPMWILCFGWCLLVGNCVTFFFFFSETGWMLLANMRITRLGLILGHFSLGNSTSDLLSLLNMCSWNGQLRPSKGRGLAIEGAILLAAQDPTGSCWPCQGCSARDHWHQAFDCKEGLAICPERSPLISQLLALWPQHHRGFQAQGTAEIIEGSHC